MTVWIALAMFAAMYVLLLRFPDHRYLIALCTAALFMITGMVSPADAIANIDWNVIMMIGGTMATVSLFIESRMPARMAETLLKHTSNVCWAVIALSALSGIISAFVDNVATVLMVAPVGLAVAEKLKINPVPVIISISVSSNLQGAATLVGDTTSILLGQYAGMSFNDFFVMNGRPGIALAVETGAIASLVVLYGLFRKEKAPVNSEVVTKVTDYVPSFLMLATIGGLIIASQFQNKPALTNGIICVSVALVGILYECLHRHSSAPLAKVMKEMDYKTLLLLAGLFMVIAGITEAGVIDLIADFFLKIGGSSKLVMYVLIVGVSEVLSAFIDNIPYVATMLPVVRGIASMMGMSDPYLFYFGLLIGATLGGNLTPVGASANIAGIGVLQKKGYQVSTKDFMRIGVPFTLTAAICGAAVVWLFWA